MTHSLYCNRKPKRENECDDFDHNVPSAKRLKSKNSRDNQMDNMIDGNCSFYSTSQNAFEESAHKNQNTNVGFQRDVVQCDIIQPEISCIPREYAAIHQINFKYLPDLSAVENPHYYENNRLLFELNMERIRRAASQLVCTPSHQFSQ